MATSGTAARLCPATGTTPEQSGRSVSASLAMEENSSSKRGMQPAERERLLLLHLPQVRLVAESLRVRLRFAMEFEDLVSYGVIGLLHAIERFDPSRGVLLKTYAEHRIRGAILDGARAMDWLPRGVRQKERLYQNRVREAEGGQADGASGSPGAAPAPERRPPRRPVVRMEVIFAGADLDVFETLSEQAGLRGMLGKVGDDPEAELQRAEMQTMLHHAVSRLPERHRTVLELYYQHELSMKRIGQILHIHESRVSQLHAAAVKRLRSALAPELERKKADSGDWQKPAVQPPAGKPSKYLVTAARSSSVSTPMVSSAVSAT